MGMILLEIESCKFGFFSVMCCSWSLYLPIRRLYRHWIKARRILIYHILTENSWCKNMLSDCIPEFWWWWKMEMVMLWGWITSWAGISTSLQFASLQLPKLVLHSLDIFIFEDVWTILNKGLQIHLSNHSKYKLTIRMTMGKKSY